MRPVKASAAIRAPNIPRVKRVQYKTNPTHINIL